MTMIGAPLVHALARYNAWQNRSLIDAAGALEPEARTRDRGAFFGSILRTFSHLYWGDAMWLHRFHGTPKPSGTVDASPDLIGDWAAFTAKRAALDAAILGWASEVDQAWLDATPKPGGAPNGLLVAHFFNHQTHHRGQIHAMLTAAGASPGPTDLFKMPAR